MAYPPVPEQAMPSHDSNLANALADAVVDFLGIVPPSQEPPVTVGVPADHARALARSAAVKASVVAGSLALPPGPLGLLTIIPDLVAVWRIQSQMVADIAAAYGKSAQLTREQMLYCLFKHAAAQAVRDLTMRVGERFVFRRATVKALQLLSGKVGIKLSQRVIAKTAARWLPVVGAAGVAAYAYYDTGQVAETAIKLFESDSLEVIDEAERSSAPDDA
jgi:hypothetical protein